MLATDDRFSLIQIAKSLSASALDEFLIDCFTMVQYLLVKVDDHILFFTTTSSFSFSAVSSGFLKRVDASTRGNESLG